MEGPIDLGAIANLLLCSLCGGCFRDACTVKECQHTFCHSCLMRYLGVEDSKPCPVCVRRLQGDWQCEDEGVGPAASPLASHGGEPLTSSSTPAAAAALAQGKRSVGHLFQLPPCGDSPSAAAGKSSASPQQSVQRPNGWEMGGGVKAHPTPAVDSVKGEAAQCRPPQEQGASVLEFKGGRKREGGASRSSPYNASKVSPFRSAHTMPRSLCCGPGAEADVSRIAANGTSFKLDRTIQNIVDKLMPFFAEQELNEMNLIPYLASGGKAQLANDSSICATSARGLHGDVAGRNDRAGPPPSKQMDSGTPVQEDHRTGKRGPAPENFTAKLMHSRLQTNAHSGSSDAAEAAGGKEPRSGSQPDCSNLLKRQRRVDPRPIIDGTVEFFRNVLTDSFSLARLQNMSVALFPDRSEKDAALRLPELPRPYLRISRDIPVHQLARYVSFKLARTVQPANSASQPPYPSTSHSPHNNASAFSATSPCGTSSIQRSRGCAQSPFRGSSFSLGLSSSSSACASDAASYGASFLPVELFLEGWPLPGVHSIYFVCRSRMLDPDKCLLIAYRVARTSPPSTVPQPLFSPIPQA
eukprot:GHVT01077731.1.p1 GENE.GHVT01077731.1~~GHVT01077731.1.p1  ORF type:complete len:582 (+),score=100.96 GHVT01077731.1:715-2460(+)